MAGQLTGFWTFLNKDIEKNKVKVVINLYVLIIH